MSFEEFAALRLRDLLRIATTICADRHDAEDLVQDVLIKAQKHWTRISETDIPMAYLRRMLVNEFISAKRKSGRTYPVADIEPAQVWPDHAERNADRDELRSEIGRLPRKQQAVLALRYYEGLSDDEIADVLGCRVGTVRGYVSRALATLRVTHAASLISANGEPR